MYIEVIKHPGTHYIRVINCLHLMCTKVFKWVDTTCMKVIICLVSLFTGYCFVPSEYNE